MSLRSRRSTWTDLDLAWQRPAIETQQIDYRFRDVSGLELPRLLRTCRVAAEVGVYTAGTYIADLDSFVTYLLHQGFRETVEREFGSIVSRHFRMCVLSGE